MGNAQLPFDIAGLALLVDEQTDDGCSVLLRQFHDPVESAALMVAIFEIR